MPGALAYVEELREHHVPMLLADDLHALRLAHETENMVITAEMKLKALADAQGEPLQPLPPRLPGYRLRELAGLDQHLAGRKRADATGKAAFRYVAEIATA